VVVRQAVLETTERAAQVRLGFAELAQIGQAPADLRQCQFVSRNHLLIPLKHLERPPGLSGRSGFEACRSKNVPFLDSLARASTIGSAYGAYGGKRLARRRAVL